MFCDLNVGFIGDCEDQFVSICDAYRMSIVGLQDACGDKQKLYSVTVYRVPKENIGGIHDLPCPDFVEVYTGLGLVDSVGVNFGTAVFCHDGKKEILFFYKSDVLVDGERVADETPLTSVLNCDMTVSFKGEMYIGGNCDAQFRATVVCVWSDSMPLLASKYGDLPPWNSSFDNDITHSLSYCQARIKHISEEGGVLDEPEVWFDRSVVCIPESLSSTNSLPTIIPAGTLVKFNAVQKDSHVTVTCLWKVEPVNVLPICGVFKGLSGVVECYTSANLGRIKEIKIHGQKITAIFCTEVVYFPESLEITLEEYIPVGSNVHFDGKLEVLGDFPYIKVLFLWRGKRPAIISGKISDQSKLIQKHDDSGLLCTFNGRNKYLSVKEAMAFPFLSSLDLVHGSSDVGEKSSPIFKEILKAHRGFVKCYNTPSEGVIKCIISNVLQEVLFMEGSVCVEPELHAKELARVFPVETIVNFNAKIKLICGKFQYVATDMWTDNKSKQAVDIFTGDISDGRGVLHECPAKLLYFVSDSEGLLEFYFKGSCRKAFFHKNVVNLPEGVTVSVEEYLTIVRNIVFNGWIENEDSVRVIITSLWSRKTESSWPPKARLKMQISSRLQDSRRKPDYLDGHNTNHQTSAYNMGNFNLCKVGERNIFENFAITSGGSKVPCCASPLIKGHIGSTPSYKFENTGVSHHTILGSEEVAEFHKKTVHIPDKSLEQHLPYDESVHIAQEVAMNKDTSVQTMAKLWDGRNQVEPTAEILVVGTVASADLSEGEVYEAEVVDVDELFFTASILQGGDRIPVFVWHQCFRPSLLVEEPLREGELVSVHISIGDRVLLRAERNRGGNKDQFKWRAFDAWKDSGTAAVWQTTAGSRNDNADGEGSVVEVHRMSIVLQDRTSGIVIHFQRENVLLFGVPLAAMDLTNVFMIGDSLFYNSANEVDASKVWFGSRFVKSAASTFMVISSFCEERFISTAVKRALVSQLCRQTWKELGYSLAPQSSQGNFPELWDDRQLSAKEKSCDEVSMSNGGHVSTVGNSDSDVKGAMLNDSVSSSVVIDLPQMGDHHFNHHPMGLLPNKNKQSSLAMSVSVANTTDPREKCHGTEYPGGSPLIHDSLQLSAQVKNGLASGRAFFHMLESQLEVVLQVKGVEPLLSHEVASKVVKLVRCKAVPCEGVAHHDLGMARLRQDAAVGQVEGSVQTVSTGNIISLHHLPSMYQ